MKKRGRESILTDDDSEKVNHKIDDGGIESPQKDGYAAIKKLKVSSSIAFALQQLLLWLNQNLNFEICFSFHLYL